MTSLDERIYKLMRSLDRHRERYLRAWMSHYRAHPADVHIVTRMGAAFDGGDVMRLEFRTDSDHVVELVRVASELVPVLEQIGTYPNLVRQLEATLKHFVLK